MIITQYSIQKKDYILYCDNKTVFNTKKDYILYYDNKTVFNTKKRLLVIYIL
jgi:hypothetical protein